MIYNVYCDESRHLERDHQPVMLLGATWCPFHKAAGAAKRLREIKVRHGLSEEFEIKWSKVSPAKVNFYRDILDYFFDDDDLHFRVLIASKTGLSHARFNQSHDTWYYKMYFTMLKTLLRPDARFRIYIDYKDTQGAAKVRGLHDVLCSSIYDFSHSVVERTQLVRSHEIQLIQLTDLLLGAVGYANVTLSAPSSAKTALVERVRERSKYHLTRTTLPREEKFNIFVWRGKSLLDEAQ
jgi:hypothetical protein